MDGKKLNVCLTNCSECLENRKKHMKTLLKAIVITVGTALAAAVAQAETETDLLTGAVNPSDTINVTSTANFDSVNNVWDYMYMLTLSTASGIDAFAVDSPSWDNLTLANIVAGGATSPFTFVGVISDNVSWSSSSLSGATEGLKFTFTSPDAPTQGLAFAQDDDFYSNAGGQVFVPNVPDGGTTMALLGCSLMGLQVLRRKLAR